MIDPAYYTPGMAMSRRKDRARTPGRSARRPPDRRCPWTIEGRDACRRASNRLTDIISVPIDGCDSSATAHGPLKHRTVGIQAEPVE